MIKDMLRETDVFCRWGGDEFAILLPDTDLEGGRLLAERIRAGVNRGVVKGVEFSVSTGVGQHSTDEAIDSLLERVDAALYLARKNGGDRVETSN